MKLFKKFLMPCGLCAAVPTMKPASSAEENIEPCNTNALPKQLIKPSELPIYTCEDGYSKQMPCAKSPSVVELNVKKIREAVQGLKVMYNEVSNNVSSTVENFKFVIDYLQDESNLMPRVGAVGIGGLSGLVLGLRGGFFKRFVYTSAGAGIVGAICFPRETKEALNTVEHYGNIGYNFIYGVKPGDSKKEISFKEFPLMQTLLESEFVNILLQPFKQNTSNTATEKTESEEDKILESRCISFQRKHGDRSKPLESVILNESPPIEETQNLNDEEAWMKSERIRLQVNQK